MQGAYSHWFPASEKKSAPITIVANELIQRFPARYIKIIYLQFKFYNYGLIKRVLVGHNISIGLTWMFCYH